MNLYAVTTTWGSEPPQTMACRAPYPGDALAMFGVDLDHGWHIAESVAGVIATVAGPLLTVRVEVLRREVEGPAERCRMPGGKWLNELTIEVLKQSGMWAPDVNVDSVERSGETLQIEATAVLPGKIHDVKLDFGFQF